MKGSLKIVTVAVGIGLAISTQVVPAFGLELPGLSQIFNAETLEQILADNGIDLSTFKQVLSRINSPESIGLNDLGKFIKIEPVDLTTHGGGVNWAKILTDPKLNENNYRIASGSSESQDATSVGVDYVMLSQLLQAANAEAANINEVTQSNNLVTKSIFQDAAATYDEAAANPPNSTLEALEQSNKIAIANGMIGVAQTKHLQNLARSLETNSAIQINSLNEERVDRLKENIHQEVVDYNVRVSQALRGL
jgi:hypothetical protein